MTLNQLIDGWETTLSVLWCILFEHIYSQFSSTALFWASLFDMKPCKSYVAPFCVSTNEVSSWSELESL
uniref:Uncharacterized protein n=1 Tax=Arundo donax TaxID=35708 RepID=A0A0A9EN38_ARUDO